jgi:hypothetical protein
MQGLERFKLKASLMEDRKQSLVPHERIENLIILVRGQKVMLDQDLATLYGVETRKLVQAVKRNIDRFPEDFMFQLTKDEFDLLRSQIVTSKQRGGRRYPPYAFSEQGVAMLSSVLNSKLAIHVNIEIMRAFVRLRKMIASHVELSRKFEKLEKKYDSKFKVIFDILKRLMEPPDKKKRPIGFLRRDSTQNDEPCK